MWVLLSQQNHDKLCNFFILKFSIYLLHSCQIDSYPFSHLHTNQSINQIVINQIQSVMSRDVIVSWKIWPNHYWWFLYSMVVFMFQFHTPRMTNVVIEWCKQVVGHRKSSVNCDNHQPVRRKGLGMAGNAIQKCLLRCI